MRAMLARLWIRNVGRPIRLLIVLGFTVLQNVMGPVHCYVDTYVDPSGGHSIAPNITSANAASASP